MAWHLDTRILRMIIAVAESPSLAVAAARLNITPSALSHQMRNAESALRVTLFERAARRVSLAPLGEQVLASARTIIGELERTEETLDLSRNSETPSLRVSGGAYPIHRWFLPAHGQSVATPRMDFLGQARTQSLARSVALGALDLAFAPGTHHERGVDVVPLFEDELVAVFATGHALSSQSFIEASHLKKETYVTYSRVLEYGLEDDLLFKPAKCAPADIREASSVETILDIVSAGVGFTILSRWAVQTSPNFSNLDVRALTQTGLFTKWSALTRLDSPNGAVIGEALAYLTAPPTMSSTL